MSAAGRFAASGTRRLWSVGEVLETLAISFIALGERTANVISLLEKAKKKPLSRRARQDYNECLKHMGKLCSDLGLTVSGRLIESAAKRRRPMSPEEFQMMVQANATEVRERNLFYIPEHRRKYFQLVSILSDRASDAFPSVAQELTSAGDAFACGLNTACVFHAMRAAEFGVRLMGRSLGVVFPDKPIELAEWHQILDQIHSKIRAIGQQSKTAQRDADLEFYSAAASQFRYFKDGWRVQVAHARASYTEPAALRVLDHTRDFFDGLAERFSEEEA